MYVFRNGRVSLYHSYKNICLCVLVQAQKRDTKCTYSIHCSGRNVGNNNGDGREGAKPTVGIGKSDASSLCPVKCRFLIVLSLYTSQIKR